MYETANRERALLVTVAEGREEWPIEVLGEEFRHLVESARIEVADMVHVKLREPNASLFIGSGKAQELADMVKTLAANVVIFNCNLHVAHQRNLEDLFGVKTIDRTQLILDIFAAHARTQEGLLEVELAQLQYLLPRLKGKGTMLSRLGGGIGTRGPGEQKLEIDRRRIEERILRLGKEIEDHISHREVIRKKRRKENVCVCSLVGYTSAGKTTLFNSLTASDEKTSSDLFTTLDTVSRQFTLHDSLKVVVTDTVGFIHNLPPHLIKAFKATLEELQYADLILHVIDASSSDYKRLKQSVEAVLDELKLGEKRLLMIFNKIDLMDPDDVADLKWDHPQAVFISAKEKTNIEGLREKIYAALFADMAEVVLRFPFSRMEMADYIHKNSEVLKKDYQAKTVVYTVRINRDNIPYLLKNGVSVKETKKTDEYDH